MSRACSNCHFSHVYAAKGDPAMQSVMNERGVLDLRVAPLLEDKLLCRRHAPTRAPWPYVSADEWCGEFEEKRHD